MIQGLRLSAAGARAQSLAHDVIAHNLANVNTTGFKRHLAIVGKTGDTNLKFMSPVSPGGSAIGGAAGLPTLAATPQETGTGALVRTGGPADLALEGEGYFVISDGKNTYYTRAGHFDVDETGRLLTADHQYRVQSAAGGDIILDGSIPFEVREDGRVMQEGAVVAQLKTVAFRHPEDLVPVGGARLVAPPGVRPTETRPPAVRQGYLEHSTVQAVRELVAMMDAYRAYEANLGLIQRQDATLGRLINDAGRLA